jgi:hypothetical protein
MTNRLPQAALIMPAILFCEMLALGADGPFLGAVAAVAEIAGAMIVLWLLRPGMAFWRAFAVPLLAAAAAWAWLASAMAPGPDMFGRVWDAPDLLPSALARFLGGCAVLLASAAVGWRRRGLRLSIDYWLLLGLVQLAVALFLRQSDPNSVWGVDKGFLRDRFTGTFVNANAAGCLYAVLATLALGRGIMLWRSRFAPASLMTQVVAPVALLGGLGACAITGSRTALVAGLAVLFLLAVQFGWTEYRNRAKGNAATVFAATAMAILLVLALVGESTAERFRQVDQDSGLRMEIWSFYARLAGAAPLGHGPGGLEDAALRAYASVNEANMLWFVNSAHDIFLSLMINGGWPYLLLMIMLTGALLFPLRHRQAREQGATLASAVGALAIMLVCSSVDIALDMPGMAALGAMLLGLVWGAAASAVHDDRRSQSLSTRSRASTSGAAGV